MRTAFIETLQQLAREDERITLVVGDLGFGVVVEFRDELPRQFVNAGVAEQNMTGLAAGLALEGRKVFTYSIANFPVLRCVEQIRNDVCYHGANVTIVAVGGGMCYGSLGISHHATEDLAVLRAMPDLLVVAPGDPIETIHATRAIVAHDGPCYLRLGRAGEERVHRSDAIDFELGRAITVREGEDITLVSTGGLLIEATRVAEALSERGVEARVLSMHTLKPFDADAVLAAARETRAVFSVEEHSVLGGLGSAVAEVLAEAGTGGIFRRIGLQDRFSSEVGTQEYLKARYGLDAAGIQRVVESTLAECLDFERAADRKS